MRGFDTKAETALAGIERACGEGLRAQELVEEIATRVVPLLEAEAFFAGSTDPDTGLCLGAGVVHGMTEEICHPFWDHEFSVPDYNKFADLTPERPAADLHEATGGRIERSARWRAFHDISDLDAELRVAMHAGGRMWGLMQVNRHSGSPRFAPEHVAFLARLAPIAGAGLRAAMLNETAPPAAGRGPGTLILDARANIVASTPEADAWLEELPLGDWMSMRTPLPVPIEVFALALMTTDDEGAPAARRARLRTRTGMWLIAHASRLSGTDQIAMVIEPAKASEVAPVIVEAYGLTPREVEVTQMVALGLKTDEIGARLYLSPHTVRDHLKAVFEKVGVSSRGELVSQLFAEHYRPTYEGALDRAAPGVPGRLERAAAELASA
jgi:DNA-binding CsgD family transcriptional regulator